MAAPKKLFKVGEIMRHTKLSRQTIHNYTMLGLIKPAERTDSGHRLYGEEVFDRIKKIEMLKRHHTLDEVRNMLVAEDAAKSGGAAPSISPA
jgi:DNA-binding transcriptional MerR regulator